jgi:hypothetical protein
LPNITQEYGSLEKPDGTGETTSFQSTLPQCQKKNILAAFNLQSSPHGQIFYRIPNNLAMWKTTAKSTKSRSQ